MVLLREKSSLPVVLRHFDPRESFNCSLHKSGLAEQPFWAGDYTGGCVVEGLASPQNF